MGGGGGFNPPHPPRHIPGPGAIAPHRNGRAPGRGRITLYHSSDCFFFLFFSQSRAPRSSLHPRQRSAEGEGGGGGGVGLRRAAGYTGRLARRDTSGTATRRTCASSRMAWDAECGVCTYGTRTLQELSPPRIGSAGGRYRGRETGEGGGGGGEGSVIRDLFRRRRAAQPGDPDF